MTLWIWLLLPSLHVYLQQQRNCCLLCVCVACLQKTATFIHTYEGASLRHEQNPGFWARIWVLVTSNQGATCVQAASDDVMC